MISQNNTDKVLLGCENFLAHHLASAKGKRMGLITNQTGIDHQRRSLVDIFQENSEVKLVALYAPEHGLKGDAQAGQTIPFSRHDKYDIPVYSLYGQFIEADSRNDSNLDAQMRSFDTVEDGKMPNFSMVENVDVLVFDIQDIGTRIYTYIATMAYSMQVCAEIGIDFVVLDRPNPINGVDMEGPLLEYPEFSSFVGLYPIPVRHGMTIGELACMFNDRFLSNRASLSVIPMKRWTRDMWYDQTGLFWIPPSPNIPTLQTATVYPGQVFLEGTNVSEGRGTTKPFQQFGAPWINGRELALRLNGLSLSGVKFKETMFSPYFSKYKDELCSGVHIHVLDRNIFQPFKTTLHIIHTIKNMYPKNFLFHSHYFDLIIGSPSVRQEMEEGVSVDKIVQAYRSGVEEFGQKRKPYLLYDEAAQDIESKL